MFDYSKLRGRIREVFGTQERFANAIGLGRVTMSRRLNNALDFSQREIDSACRALQLLPSEIPTYFFTPKVQKDERNDVA